MGLTVTYVTTCDCGCGSGVTKVSRLTTRTIRHGDWGPMYPRGWIGRGCQVFRNERHLIRWLRAEGKGSEAEACQKGVWTA